MQNFSSNQQEKTSTERHLVLSDDGKIDWVKFFSERKPPKRLKYKPSQKKLYTSGKAPLIMQYYCENKDTKKLLTMSRELKKMYNFSCTFNTISHFILFILEETDNLKNFDIHDEGIDSSSDEEEMQNEDKIRNWEGYFKGKKPKSIQGKRSQEEIWEDGVGPEMMRFYYQHKNDKTLYVIAKMLKEKYNAYSVSTIKRFIDNVQKDCMERFNGMLQDEPSTHSTEGEEKEAEKSKKHVRKKKQEVKESPIKKETKPPLVPQVDWKIYFQKCPAFLQSKQLKAIWESGKGSKIMEYYAENRDKKELSNISMELKKMYHLTSSCKMINHFILQVLEDASKNDDEDIQNVNWEEYFKLEAPKSIQENENFFDWWNNGTGILMMKYFSENVENNSLPNILEDLKNKFNQNLEVIKQFVKNIINDLCDHERQKERRIPTVTNNEQIESPKKRKLSQVSKKNEKHPSVQASPDMEQTKRRKYNERTVTQSS